MFILLKIKKSIFSIIFIQMSANKFLKKLKSTQLIFYLKIYYNFFKNFEDEAIYFF